ncbi:MAG: ABC transporter ATP-binding protein, partial [Actinomycetota bacterium]|nr:ABC transporter ATP-binding protein [Actinomycetota bacterium]
MVDRESASQDLRHGVDGARPVLEVNGLRTHLRSSAGVVRAVDGVSFTIGKGEVFAVVGESGSGKSMMAKSVMGLAPRDAAVQDGAILFEGEDLRRASRRRLRQLRGDRIAMIFQDPLTSLNPIFPVGWQIAEALKVHRDVSRRTAWDAAVDALQKVGIPNPERRARDYPHQFSGGMQQRAMIAMAMICDPRLLIADEPTTALDVTIQAQILGLLLGIRETHGTSIMLITHDLGIVAGVSDRLAVMYAGQLHEIGRTEKVFAAPRGPYTLGLLASIPAVSAPSGQPLTTIPGLPPTLVGDGDGCRFAPRCAYVTEACLTTPVPLVPRPEDGEVRCLRAEEPDWSDVVAARPVVGSTEDGAGLASIARDVEAPVRRSRAAVDEEPLLRVEGLARSFRIRRGGLG